MAAAPQPPSGAPGPPKSVGQLQTQWVGIQQQHADGMKPLDDKIQDLLKGIDITSVNMRFTLENVFKLYTDAIEERRRIVSELDAVIQNNTQATQALAAAEKSKQSAETLKQEAETKFQQSEEQKAQLAKQVQELSAAKQLYDQRIEAERRKAQALQQQNRELSSLHESQIAQITTNISTLQKLKLDLETLERKIQSTQNQALAYGSIKLYIKYPLLLKMRQIALSANILTGTTLDRNTLTSEFELLKTQAPLGFQDTLNQVMDINSKLSHLVPPVTSSFWAEYQQKLTDVLSFILKPSLDTNLTWGQYLIYKWTIEKYTASNTQITYDATITSQIANIDLKLATPQAVF